MKQRKTSGSFEDLRVWQDGCDLAILIYNLVQEGKISRDYGLKDQMTRAAVSIASNISEGAERDSIAEYIRFLHIAKGSAAELRTQVYIARQIKVLSSDEKSELVDDLKIISSMLQSLINSLNLKPKT